MTLIKVKSRGTDNVSGRRNLIINGAMQVAQRGTSSTGAGYVVCDRFKTNKAGPDITTTQHTLSTTDTPYSLGFRKSYQIHITDPQTPNAAVDYAEIEHRIEAQNVANSGWNYTNSSSKITLSFWVLSTVAGTYSVYVRDNDGSSGYSFDYTLSADTWKKVIHTIRGNSNLVFNTDNGAGLDMYFTLYYGTNYTATKTDEVWATHSSSNQVGDYAQNILATDEAKFEITGVQVEVGDSASDFEHRSFGEEMNLARRYYYQIGNTILPTSSSPPYGRVGQGQAISSTTGRVPFFFPQPMRAIPTATVSNIQIGNGATGAISLASAGIDTNTDSPDGVTIDFVVSSGLTTGQGCQAFQGNSSIGFIAFNAEL